MYARKSKQSAEGEKQQGELLPWEYVSICGLWKCLKLVESIPRNHMATLRWRSI